jgi:hypothetical protein
MEGVADDPDAYETLHGLGGRTVPALLLCLAFVIGALVAKVPVGVLIAVLVVFGGSGTALLVHGVSGRIALRVDASGVTLGGTPLRYKATTRFVPWSDIERIVLWRRWLPRGGSITYIALAGRADALQADSRVARLAAKANALAAPPISGSTYLGLRAVTGWHLDVSRLAAATAYYAPSVRIESPG